MLKNIVSKLYNHEEEQYLQLIRELIDENNNENSRSGETVCNIGSSMYFSLENNKIPILTTKKVAIKTCLKEMLWFLNGETNNKILKKQNVKIWNDNASKEFLLSRGLNYEEDDLGPVYGHQWRYFNAPYTSCNDDYTNKGIDQIQNLIDNLKNPETRYSRRHIISAWNPNQIDKMALPPCHVYFSFM